MRKSIKGKVILMVVTVLILSLSLGSVAFASGNYRTLNAWFGNISIFNNNQQVQLEVPPFIVNGTTYVPLRAIGEMVNKEILWDGVNYRIDINDKSTQIDQNIAYLTQQLVERQVKISELEAEVARLQAELEDTKANSTYTLDELEDYLNDEYGYYERISFDIELYGDEDDIEVEIYVDLDDDYSRWNYLTTSDIEDYLQDIVDDILYDFGDAYITGYIEDSSSSRNNELVSFYTTSRGSVVIDDGYSSVSDLDDMEDDLNRNHDEYEGVYFDIVLSGDEDDITVYITAINDDLDWLYTSEIEDYLEELYNEIIYEFPYAEIDGSIEDYYTEYDFDFDSRGNATLY